MYYISKNNPFMTTSQSKPNIHLMLQSKILIKIRTNNIIIQTNLMIRKQMRSIEFFL